MSSPTDDGKKASSDPSEEEEGGDNENVETSLDHHEIGISESDAFESHLNNELCSYISDNTSTRSNTGSTICPMWSRLTNRLHRMILHTVVALSVYAAGHPKLTLVAVPIISCILVAAGVSTNFTLELDFYVAFAPFDSLPMQHEHWIKEAEAKYSDSTGPGRTPFLLAIHANGGDILGKEGARRVFMAIDALRQVHGFTDICNDNLDISWKDDGCFIMSVAHFWETDIELFDEVVRSNEDVIRTMSTVKTFHDGLPVDLGHVIDTEAADSVSNNVNGTVEFVRCYFVFMALTKSEITEQFELDAIDRLLELQKEWETDPTNTDDISVEGASVFLSFPREFQRAIFKDLPLIPVGFFVMMAFVCLVFFRSDLVESRILLGIGSAITILFSTMSGFGLLFLIGIPYTNMTNMLPFVILGIGLDDTFIITGNYFRTDHSKDPLERLAHTMSTVGMSIFVTTLTTSLAFIFGLTSNVRAIYWLCLYAFPTIIIDFIYQITFFVALMILDERRIRVNRMDIFICCTVSAKNNDEDASKDNDEHNNAKDHTERTGTGNNAQSPVETIDNIEAKQDNMNELVFSSLPPTSLPDRFMVWYSEQLMRSWMKVLVLITFIALFASCVWSTTKLTQQFRPIDLVPQNSYVKDFQIVWAKYNKRTLSIEVHFRDVDQSDPDVQQQMLNYIGDLVSLDYFEGRNPQFCWIRDFQPAIGDGNLEDLEHSGRSGSEASYFLRLFLSSLDLSNMTFNEKIDSLLSIPFIDEVYGWAFLRNETGHVVASSCHLEVYDIDLDIVQEQINFLRDQRGVTADQPINHEDDHRTNWAFFTFSFFYHIFEFYSIHVDELISTTICGLIAITIVSLLFLPHWTAVLFVVPLMMSLYIDLLGVIQFAGLHMNVVTFVVLVISIGLLVDFVVHILIRYYESEEATREGKVKDALQTLGSSILVGGLSTFLAVVPLAFSTSTVIRTIYVCFLAMIALGCGYGLVLLPVLLSMFGPQNNDIIVTENNNNKSLKT